MTVKELITELNKIEDEERDVKINLEGAKLLVDDVIEPPLESVVYVGCDWDEWCEVKGKLMSNEQSQGEWKEDDNHNIVCPFCGGIRRDCRIDHINFCNRCGAKMKQG